MTCAFYSIVYDIVSLIERKINYFILFFYLFYKNNKSKKERHVAAKPLTTLVFYDDMDFLLNVCRLIRQMVTTSHYRDFDRFRLYGMCEYSICIHTFTSLYLVIPN
jgi:hypothetical protein